MAIIMSYIAYFRPLGTTSEPLETLLNVVDGQRWFLHVVDGQRWFLESFIHKTVDLQKAVLNEKKVILTKILVLFYRSG